MKHQLLTLLTEKIDGDPYLSLEHFALAILKEKIASDSASSQEKLLLVNEFLSAYLVFDPETYAPIGQTNEIEQIIDFLLYG